MFAHMNTTQYTIQYNILYVTYTLMPSSKMCKRIVLQNWNETNYKSYDEYYKLCVKKERIRHTEDAEQSVRCICTERREDEEK